MGTEIAIKFMVIAGTIFSIGGLIAVLVLLHKTGILGTTRLKEGHKGTATVLEVEPLETREASGMTVLKLVLEIKPQGREEYQIRTRRKVPTSQATSMFEVGQAFDVNISGEDNSEIVIIGFDPIPNAYAGAKYGG